VTRGLGRLAGATIGCLMLLSALCWLLVAPAPSSARSEVQISLQAHVALGGGLDAAVYARGEQGLDRAHLVISRQGKTSALQATYKSTDEGRPTAGKRIVSKLGDRGSMRLTFEPRGVPEVREYGHCSKLIDQKGVLAGYLRFRGERHYVEVLEHRLKAHRYKFVERCRRRPPPRPEFHQLTACTDAGTRLRAYSGFRDGESFIYSQGPRIEKRGLAVDDIASVSGPDPVFKISNDGSRAKLDPGPPFTGTAKLKNERLTGNLVMPTIRGPEFALTPGEGHLDDRDGCGGVRGRTTLAPAIGAQSGPPFLALP